MRPVIVTLFKSDSWNEIFEKLIITPDIKVFLISIKCVGNLDSTDDNLSQLICGCVLEMINIFCESCKVISPHSRTWPATKIDHFTSVTLNSSNLTRTTSSFVGAKCEHRIFALGKEDRGTRSCQVNMFCHRELTNEKMTSECYPIPHP
jgi:hypothetical protein